MRPWLPSKSASVTFCAHGLNSSEHHVRLNDVAELNMAKQAVTDLPELVSKDSSSTLDTSHFEMSELNALAKANTAEPKKKTEKREREEKRGEVRKF